MKVLKWLGVLLGVYVGLVVLFESSIGYFQPTYDGVLSLTVYEEDESAHVRVLSRIEHAGNLYVAVNHWPRSWFYALQENPKIRVVYDEEEFVGAAVVVDDVAEKAGLDAAFPVPFFFRFLTGFPPRHYVRLVPDAVTQ